MVLFRVQKGWRQGHHHLALTPCLLSDLDFVSCLHWNRNRARVRIEQGELNRCCLKEGPTVCKQHKDDREGIFRVEMSVSSKLSFTTVVAPCFATRQKTINHAGESANRVWSYTSAWARQNSRHFFQIMPKSLHCIDSSYRTLSFVSYETGPISEVSPYSCYKTD